MITEVFRIYTGRECLNYGIQILREEYKLSIMIQDFD